LPNARINIL